MGNLNFDLEMNRRPLMRKERSSICSLGEDETMWPFTGIDFALYFQHCHQLFYPSLKQHAYLKSASVRDSYDPISSTTNNGETSA